MIDASSFPAALPDFTPVPRKNTVTHGWTVAKQRDFIAALAASGSVRLAAEAVGMSHCGVYKLRTAPGGDSFARAWDAAVAMGASRVRDVLMDQAINGIPEDIVIGGKVLGSRRKFNHRTMMWVLQHHLPDAYPGASTTHRGGWGGRQGSQADIEEARASIMQRLAAIRRHSLRAIAADPEKRAAYELLHGVTDWDAHA